MKTKFHPMLYSTPMVQGILEGIKTKTRRTKGLEKVNINPDEWKFEALCRNPDNEEDKNLHAYFTVKGTETWMYQKCPYNVGDVLWVRENFHYIHDSDTNAFLSYGYKADNNYKGAKWKPSIHMPKVACRIFLKIKSIRVERLNEITEEDAIQEGCSKYGPFGEYKGSIHPNGGAMKYRAYSKASRAFQCIWESINGIESWNKNPFVWVYEFEQIEKPNDFI
ncbi:hypothetical protein [Flavobacterium granuli]|uniref:Uncharacterized protein n=1 Tax=Flavobacterium granuli TaxID=280093 RepID=A0ABU1S1F3_9FLAO|nr:hypothetical protein [Flavobacterium granuli]MDR6844485.1 hypothetical protein [Flavobacterium granuli]